MAEVYAPDDTVGRFVLHMTVDGQPKSYGFYFSEKERAHALHQALLLWHRLWAARDVKGAEIAEETVVLPEGADFVAYEFVRKVAL